MKKKPMLQTHTYRLSQSVQLYGETHAFPSLHEQGSSRSALIRTTSTSLFSGADVFLTRHSSIRTGRGSIFMSKIPLKRRFAKKKIQHTKILLANDEVYKNADIALLH
jgi:hypothetical protein